MTDMQKQLIQPSKNWAETLSRWEICDKPLRDEPSGPYEVQVIRNFFPRDKKRNSAYCPNLGDSKFCKYFKK